jgi:hypothetical protein
VEVVLLQLQQDLLQQLWERIQVEVFVNQRACATLLDLNQVMEEIVDIELWLWLQV